MKQFISILLIITVNLLFLTHALLPHHHHDGIPHFIFSTETHQHDYDNTEDDCCCDQSSCDDACVLDKEIDAILANDDENCYCTYHTALHHHPYDLLQTLLFFYHYDFSLPDKIPEVRQPIYPATYHHDYIARGLGLRAPPVC